MLGAQGPPGPMPMNAVQPITTSQAVSLQGSGKVLAEYIWVGQTGADLKSRTVVLDEAPSCADDLPLAEIDGSSYGVAAEDSCELYLQPKKIFPDPFRGGDHILVLCDVYVPPLVCSGAAGAEPWEGMVPHPSNHRAACAEVMKHAAHCQPVFTMQQEYTLCSDDGPFGASGGYSMGSVAMPVPVPSSKSRAAAGLSEKAAARLGREVGELHMRACLSAGLSYSGGTALSAHQHAFKVGPCLGVDMGDQLCVGRFLLHRAAERAGANVYYDTLGEPGAPAAATGNRCTLSFSTAGSRDPASGLSEVQGMMERLHSSHAEHLARYGGGGGGSPSHGGASDGSWHSSGLGDERPSPQPCGRYTLGLGAKAGSVVVPTSTLLNRCGPILDRRPPASSDPYLTSMLLVCGACGVGLPAATRCAMTLAAALLARSAAAAALSPAAAAAVPIRCASGRHSHSATDTCGSAGTASLSLASTADSGDDYCYSDSLGGLSTSADSAEVLLSALDRLDRLSPSVPLAGGYGGEGRCYGAAAMSSDVCSDASSPPLAHGGLAAAAGGGCCDEDMMFFE